MMRTYWEKYLLLATAYFSVSIWAALPLNLSEITLRQHRLMLVDELVSSAEEVAAGAAVATGTTSGTKSSTYVTSSRDEFASKSWSDDWLIGSFEAAAKCLRYDIENPGRKA